MKKQLIHTIAIAGVIVLAAVPAILPLAPLASTWEPPVPLRTETDGQTATPATTATPDKPADDEDGDLLDDISTPSQPAPRNPKNPVYSVCDYYFPYYEWPFEWMLGSEFDADHDLVNTVTVFLDGPDGHVNMDEDLEIPVSWDLSLVDFENEGTYQVSGTLDTDSCEYTVDWDSAPSPTFFFRVIKSGTLSFRPESEENTLYLYYELNGTPFSFELGNMALYETTDNGITWHEITYSSRVQIMEDYILVSGVTANSMFQAIEMNLGSFYDDCSDIAAVSTDASGSISQVRIIASGGSQGGEQWSTDMGSDWISGDFGLDGPYPILSYGLNRWRPSLTISVLKGTEEPFEPELYDNIYVRYGDRPDGFWMLGQMLEVAWDWSPLDTIDWNEVGDTIIHGNFTEEAMASADPSLDFENMPELSLTISVYEQRKRLILAAKEEAILEDQTVLLGFYEDSEYDSYDTPVSFPDGSDLTVWCSDDDGMTWYDITKLPNVMVNGDSLTISHLKDSIIRSPKGYCFQIQQNALFDYETYSSGVDISHDSYGLSFSFADIGGERGGGKRQDKPSEGLFDIPAEEIPEVPGETPEVPDKTPEVPGNNNSSSGSVHNSGGTSSTPSPVPESEPKPESEPGSESQPEPDANAAAPLIPNAGSQRQAAFFTAQRPKTGKQNPPSPAQETISPEPSSSAQTQETHDPGPQPDSVTSGADSPKNEADASDTETGALRMIASLIAILTGAIAGIFMIRRR